MSELGTISKRILTLSDSQIDGDAVIYVMSRDQRVRDNHALLAAQADALKRNVPLVVLFNLYPKSGYRSREHYEFMLAGLKNVAKDLEAKNITFVMRSGGAKQSTLDLAEEVDASSIYFDFNPLKPSQKLAKDVSGSFSGASYVVDTNNIIPVWVVSDRQEFAAHTIRRKLHKHLEQYVAEPELVQTHPYTLHRRPKSLTHQEIDGVLKNIHTSGIKISFEPGEKQALEHLQNFIDDGLEAYALERNDASKDALSNLSPYRHYGHIAILRVALKITKAVDEPPLLMRRAQMAQAGAVPSKIDGMNALFEEIIVRQALSDNFCFYAKSYTSLAGAPDWGIASLEKHK